MNKHGWTGERQGIVRIKKPLGTNTRGLDRQGVKQYGRLTISRNISLGYTVPGLVQEPRGITEVLGSLLLSVLHLSNVRQPMSPRAPFLPASHPHVTVSLTGRGSGEETTLVGWFLC